MKYPKPHWWPSHKAWYAQVNGQKYVLGRDKNNPREAELALYKILSEEKKVKQKQDQSWEQRTIQELHDEFFAEKQPQWSANTIQAHKTYTTDFLAKFGELKIEDFKPDRFMVFLNSLQKWNETTRYHAFMKALAIFKWAVDKELIQRTPFKGVKNPHQAIRRTRILTDEETARLLKACQNHRRFHQFLRFLRATGCRPGELSSITAQDIHPTDNYATLPPTRHKTGKKTSKPRIIVIPSDLMPELRELAKEFPNGPLFRNRNRNPWIRTRLTIEFERVRARAGFGKDVVLYTNRHSFGTEIAKKVPLPVAAMMMGHTNTTTIMKHYFHGQTQDMIEAMKKIEEERKNK